MTKKTMIIPVVSTILLILFTAIAGSFDLPVQKWAALAGLIAIVALMFIPKAKNALKVYAGPLFFIILAYIIWNGISVFYADVPKTGLFEMTKLMIAAAVFFAILILTVPTKKALEKIATILTVSSAFFGIVSIDAASNGPIAAAFKAFMGLFTTSMQHFGIFEQGVRITGIFGNANTFAGFIALGIFLCLYLVINSANSKERTLAIVLLSIHSLTYLLLFSLGSIFMFFFACILMICTTQRGDKLAIFMLMAETGIVTLVFAAIALKTMGDSPVLPLIAVILNAAALWAVDSYVRKPITLKLEANTKAGMLVGAVILALLVGYGAAALNVIGPLNLQPSQSVMRAVYLEPGQYTLQAETEKLSSVKITTQDKTDLKVHTSTTLYEGSMEKASFTVPDGSEIIKIYFTGSAEGSIVQKAICDNLNSNNSEKIKLDYKLLPENVANRIQDLGANQNSVQRMVFFEDGIKLFKQSPVIGHGLSGYEEGVASVQNFFYETKYVHNHYIQALCDLGIIGFALFVGILVLCIVSLLKLRKKGGAALAVFPVLAACVLQMFGQAITDLTWSAGPFLVLAFAVMVLLIIAQSKAFTTEASEEEAIELLEKCANERYEGLNLKITGPAIARIITVLLSIIMAVLIALNLYAHYKAATGNCTMDQIETLAKIDQFESDDYKVTYIVSTSTYGLEENLEQANKYAKELTSNTEAVLNYLLPFYFNTAQDDKLFDTATIAAENWKADPSTWNTLFNTFDTAINPVRDNPIEILMHLFGKKEYYVDNILGYYRELQERNATYLDDAMLEPNNVVFIGKLLGIENLDIQTLPQAITIFSKTIFDSNYGVDVNNDGLPDNITVLSGNTQWGSTTLDSDLANAENETPKAASKNAPKQITKGFDGTVKIAENTTITLQTYCAKSGEYTLRLAGLKGLDGGAASKDIAILLDGQPLVVNYDENGAYVKATLKGPQAADEATGVKATEGSIENFTLMFPTGAQIERVTVIK